MTPRPAKKRAGTKRRDASTPADPKSAVLFAALVHMPFDGLTDAVLWRAADEVGVSRNEVPRVFPDGPLSLVEFFSEWADAEMVRELTRNDLASLKVRERITLAVNVRLAVLGPHKEAARRAAAFLTLPPHATTGLKLLYRTVDSIWRAVGDTSTDFNFYSKRAILAGVYSATLIRWFSDSSPDHRETEEFLLHRVDDVMQFEKFKARIRQQIDSLPSLAEIINPGRTPRPKAKAG